MDQLTLQPIRHAEGEATIPGSKSLSNRILLLAALAEGDTRITNLLDSDDVRHMRNALETLGVEFDLGDDRTVCTVRGTGGRFPCAQAELFVGNAGTAMRPLCAALCTGSGEYHLTGEPRMYERPIGDLVDPLRALGADITYTGMDGFPPLRITAAGLRGGAVAVDGSVSSQFLTALLMAAPLAVEDTTVEVGGELVSKPYIAITLEVMRRFGVQVNREAYARFHIEGGQAYRSPGSILVEGDASSASYFLALGAIRGGTVRVNGVGADSVQGDIAFLDVLAAMGAQTASGPGWLQVTRGELRGCDLDLNHIPDAAMTAAVTALFAEGRTVIRNVANWRVKETDRLAAMAAELGKTGATVEEGADYLVIDPPAAIRAAEIDTYDDHRMAMCFSLAACGDAPITINDPGCTSKTFPAYFATLASLTGS